MVTPPLQDRLRRLGRRLLAIGLAAGMGWGLAAAALLLLVCAWLDLLWELPPSLRFTCDVAALAAAVLLLAAAGWLARRRGAALALARRLDGAAGARGQILSGAD